MSLTLPLLTPSRCLHRTDYHMIAFLAYQNVQIFKAVHPTPFNYSCFIHYVNIKTKSTLTSSIPNINYILSVNLRKGVYLIGFVAPIKIIFFMRSKPQHYYTNNNLSGIHLYFVEIPYIFQMLPLVISGKSFPPSPSTCTKIYLMVLLPLKPTQIIIALPNLIILNPPFKMIILSSNT